MCNLINTHTHTHTRSLFPSATPDTNMSGLFRPGAVELLPLLTQAMLPNVSTRTIIKLLKILYIYWACEGGGYEQQSITREPDDAKCSSCPPGKV